MSVGLIMICGPPSCGKSKLASIMANNLINEEARPTFVFMNISNVTNKINLQKEMEQLMNTNYSNIVIELSQ